MTPVFGRVAAVLAAVSLATTTTAATESAQTTCFVDTPPSASAAATTSADDAAPPDRYFGPSSAFLGEDCIQFHLVDTDRNATMFRLHHGEVIENYFAEGRPVAVRVDVLATPYSAGGTRLYYKGVVVGDEELDRYVPARPFTFGGVDHVAAPDGGENPSLRLVPLWSLGQYGNHTFTAILVDEYGLDRAKSTITVSVATEEKQQQHSYNNGQQQLFMDAPEREAFLRRINIRHRGKNRAAAVVVGNGGDAEDGSSSAITMRPPTNRHHRVVPLQRRVRLAGLPVKYFLHRTKRRKSSSQ